MLFGNHSKVCFFPPHNESVVFILLKLTEHLFLIWNYTLKSMQVSPTATF